MLSRNGDIANPWQGGREGGRRLAQDPLESHCHALGSGPGRGPASVYARSEVQESPAPSSDGSTPNTVGSTCFTVSGPIPGSTSK